MQIVNMSLVIVFFPILLVYISALIKPNQKSFEKSFGKNPTRKMISKGFIPLLSILLILMGITAPPAAPSQSVFSQSQFKQQEIDTETAKIKEAARIKAIEDAKPQTKEVVEKSTIPYTTETKDDSSLVLGSSSTTREGVDGEKLITYLVTYIDSKETGRAIKGEQITKEPISKVVTKGTYVAPSSISGSGNGYINSQGNYVPSPSSDPAGATAKCSDGTYSYSQSRRGTCSHHGGVAIWL